jgi:hypothetical protein
VGGRIARERPPAGSEHPNELEERTSAGRASAAVVSVDRFLARERVAGEGVFLYTTPFERGGQRVHGSTLEPPRTTGTERFRYEGEQS